jgi:hypothetical protein
VVHLKVTIAVASALHCATCVYTCASLMPSCTHTPSHPLPPTHTHLHTHTPLTCDIPGHYSLSTTIDKRYDARSMMCPCCAMPRRCCLLCSWGVASPRSWQHAAWRCHTPQWMGPPRQTPLQPGTPGVLLPSHSPLLSRACCALHLRACGWVLYYPAAGLHTCHCSMPVRNCSTTLVGWQTRCLH